MLDALIAQQVLLALQPAALEVSVQAWGDIEQERQRLPTHWQQTRQRAQYDVAVAPRRYPHVDPAHRLVASTLERQWEQALVARRQLQEDYERFQPQSPARLSAHERARIRPLAADIPTLWHSTQTTNKDRHTIGRCVLERVIVHVPPDSEDVEGTRQWAGGHQTRLQLVRPVATYAPLRDVEGLMRRITKRRQVGHPASQIAQT